MTTDERLEILKELLLTDEKKPENDIYRKLKDLEERQQHLSDRVGPILDERLLNFVKDEVGIL